MNSKKYLGDELYNSIYYVNRLTFDITGYFCWAFINEYLKIDNLSLLDCVCSVELYFI